MDTSPSVSSVFRSRAVWIAALGYFVDVYDLVLFGIVRVASLQGIGIPESELTTSGAMLLNLQMAGMLAGGFAWGLCADRFGRMRALYGSILLYSVANIANAFVGDLASYGALRFLAGFGLAGELGAAVTLVSETLARTSRGIGATVIGFAGFLGAVCAGTLGGMVSWQGSYLIGGLLGLALLAARVRVGESGIYSRARAGGAASAGLGAPLGRLLLSAGSRWRFVRCIFVGVPIWFVSGILMYFAPELGRELGLSGPVFAGQAILWNYAGALLGDPAAGFLSQRLRSRKNGILAYLGLTALLVPLFFFALRESTPLAFYAFAFALGISNGYWTLFVAMTAEQFGTEVRATVATAAPNLVRAAVIPMSGALLALRGALGPLDASLAICVCVVVAALAAMLSLPETFERDLDYLEAG
jgi:MFS family permease